MNLSSKLKKNPKLLLIIIISSVMIPSMLIIGYLEEIDYLNTRHAPLIMIAFVFVLLGIAQFRRKVKRMAFTKETKKRVLKRQNHRCKICGTYPNHWDFDHIGSRGDNSASNCQALCLDCHRAKTVREKRQRKNR